MIFADASGRSPTLTSPETWIIPPSRPSTSARSVKVSPGFAAPRIFAPRTPVRRRFASGGIAGSLCATTPPSWAIASIRITPGISGFPGKCPARKPSSPRTR